jgi:hypothetical protein
VGKNLCPAKTGENNTLCTFALPFATFAFKLLVTTTTLMEYQDTAKTLSHDQILAEFRKQYGHLEAEGLVIRYIGNVIEYHYAIWIEHPLIFDQRKLPKWFMGIEVRDHISDIDSIPEFQIEDRDTEYIWDYKRFEKFVDRNSALIRQKLGNPNMTREEMLDVLCDGDFNKHKEDCLRWEKEGRFKLKIPPAGQAPKSRK